MIYLSKQSMQAWHVRIPASSESSFARPFDLLGRLCEPTWSNFNIETERQDFVQFLVALSSYCSTIVETKILTFNKILYYYHYQRLITWKSDRHKNRAFATHYATTQSAVMPAPCNIELFFTEMAKLHFTISYPGDQTSFQGWKYQRQ